MNQTQAGEKHKTGQCRKSCSETMFIEDAQTNLYQRERERDGINV